MGTAEAVDAANPPGAGASRARTWQVALLLAVAAFAVNLAIAQRLDGLRAFRQADLFFNADVAMRWRCMVADQCGGRSSFSHPNLALFVNPPLELAASALSLGGLTGIDPARARRLVALGLSPFASAVKAPVVLFVLLGLGLTLPQAALLAALSVVSFSQLVFGAIPESFALSGLAIALAYGLALRAMRSGDRRLWPWVLLGIATAGITLSNLVVVVVLFAVVGRRGGERWRALLGRSALLALLVLAPTAALPQIVGDVYRLEEVDLAGGSEYTRRWLKPQHFSQRALATPSAWAHTFAAAEPDLGRNLSAKLLGNRYPYRFVMRHRDDVFCFRHPMGLLLALLFAAGALCYRHAPAHARWMCGASLMILGGNAALHSIWGVDLFLYSQHWQLSLLVLLAGVGFWPALPARGLNALLAGLVLAVIAQNAAVASSMLSTLQTNHRDAVERPAAAERAP